MVNVQSVKCDKCVWCAREQEGVEVVFDDGSISGFVCWSDFRKLLKARSKAGGNDAPRKPVKSALGRDDKSVN
jgi:hypothetical protein